MVGWVALLWLVEVVDVVSGRALDDFGIIPRVPGELVDIVPAAFLHFGFAHLAANSVPLLVLGFLAALGGLPRFAAMLRRFAKDFADSLTLTAPRVAHEAPFEQWRNDVEPAIPD